MIVISHNLNDVIAVADRVAVLRLGRLVAVGPMAQFDAESDRRPDDHGYLEAPRPAVAGPSPIGELQ